MSKRTLFRLSSLLAAIAAMFSLGIAPAFADTGADGFTILYASQNDIAHKCNVIGSDKYGNEAVVCADLYTTDTLDLGVDEYPYFAWAGVEAYCQNSSDVVVRCANIYESVSISDGAGDVIYAGQECGHAYGACPAGRYDDQTTTASGGESGYLEYDESDDCSTDPSSGFDVWSVAYGGGITSVELPESDKTVDLGSGNANDGENESTGHYYACF